MPIAADIPGELRMFTPTGHPPILFTLLRAIGLAVAAPFLLVVLLAALVAVVVDFAFFRVHAAFIGDLHPKGLWEF
jgi:hypothetical protein